MGYINNIRMWKTKTILILSFSVVLGLVLGPSWIFIDRETAASQVYLPKADLIKGVDPEVYILENGVRRWIPDPDIFNQFGYDWQNIKNVPDNLLESYPLGDKLSRYSDYPEGSLIKGTGPEVYLIELGKRRWIPSPEIFEGSGFGWRYIIQVDDKKLKRIKESEYLTLMEINKYPETKIISGPDSKETLEATEVTFEYSGTNPLGSKSNLSFETYLVGYDKDWRRQGKKYSKTYKLPKESGSYTFYVRAKNEEGYYDSSPASFSFQVGLSPYYQKVEIKRVRPKEKNFQDDYLVIRNDEKQTIDISGWTIETNLAKVAIPQAIKELSHPFSSADQTNIRLEYKDEMIISAGSSPRGINFKTNKCTGYLDQSERFYPSLDEDCPRLDESEYDHLNPACRDFIKKLSRCEIPDYSDNPAVNSDSECTGFLNEKFNYQQCYLDHHQEMDFLQSQWRIFLKRSVDIFPNSGDTIILRDESGLIIDEYTY